LRAHARTHTHAHTKEETVSGFLVLTNTSYTCNENLMKNWVNSVAVRGGSSLRSTAFETDFFLTLNFYGVGGEKSGALSSPDIGKHVVPSRVSRQFLGTDLRSVCRRFNRLHNNYHSVLIIIKLL
jgi:hypothetical protein